MRLWRNHTELQGLFGKPKLSKKLKRPPFAYIRAVVLAAFEAAAIGAGLFTPEEMGETMAVAGDGDDGGGGAAAGGGGERGGASQPTPDRRLKTQFLVKLIAWATYASGERLDVFVSPAKVVAGQQAVATNLLLQLVGRVVKGDFEGAAGTMSPDAAVAAVLSAGEVGLYQRAIMVRSAIVKCQAILRAKLVARRKRAEKVSEEEEAGAAAGVTAAAATAASGGGGASGGGTVEADLDMLPTGMRYLGHGWRRCG